MTMRNAIYFLKSGMDLTTEIFFRVTFNGQKDKSHGEYTGAKNIEMKAYFSARN